MKYLLIGLILLASCTKEAPVEIKPTTPVDVITPTTPAPSTGEAAYKDTDCGREVPANFSSIVKESVKDKTLLMQSNTSPIYWAAFFKALAKAESCLKPNDRYVEKGLGKDAVTGTQNTSEGLFQMSYQDSKYHGCKFDWSVDKKLATTSLDKTIFNLNNQIDCAAIVLNKQLKTKPLYSRYYWAVLDPADARHKEFKKYLKSEGF